MSRNRMVMLVATGIALAAAGAAGQPEFLWGSQPGTAGWDAAIRMSADGEGGMFVAGRTTGDLGGLNAGGTDAWLARYDRDGARLWIAQFGTGQDDMAFVPASDGDGGAFVAGLTLGSLGGQNAGEQDAWLARYDGSGQRLWIRQFGTAVMDVAYIPVPDGAGGVFVAGLTRGDLGGPNGGGTNSDVWLARYDVKGDRAWILQFGTDKTDSVSGLAPDGSGGVFIGGGTYGDLGGKNAGQDDAWIARYDDGGARLWLKQFGTAAAEEVRDVASDSAGGAFLAGHTAGKLGGAHYGGFDSWLARIDGDGDRAWTEQFGTAGWDEFNALAADGAGFVLAAGYTTGDLGGHNAGMDDAWVARYDGAGTREWITQFGSDAIDMAWGVAPDSAGGCYVSGSTEGGLFGDAAGGEDGFLARFGGACYADFTGDGVLDLFDFLGYVNTFNEGDAGADCDGNGPLDLFDFLCFVNAFNAGC